MSVKIFVGYTTRPVPDEILKDLMPKFEGRSGTKDEEKIKEQIAEKEAKWKEDCADMPYTGTFDAVHIVVPCKELSVTYKSDGRQPFGEKPSVSAQVRAFLMKHFKDVWGNEMNSRGTDEAIFVGFNPRRFLKMLGIECSLPEVGKPCPAELWFGNSEHRDIEEAVMPKDFKLLDWKTVIARRRLGLDDDVQKDFDELFEDWDGPGADPEQDVAIAITMATQLGFEK
jgi:hypothetical protein